MLNNYRKSSPERFKISRKCVCDPTLTAVYFSGGPRSSIFCPFFKERFFAHRYVQIFLSRFFIPQQLRESCTGCVALNLGTGSGYSVMDVVKGMEEASGKPIPYKVISLI